MPVIDIGSLIKDEHLKAVKMFEKHLHPSEGDSILARPPANFSKSPATIRRMAPRFGENGPEILRDTGYDDEAIIELSASGALIIDNGVR